jgi:hypothetical protein
MLRSTTITSVVVTGNKATIIGMAKLSGAGSFGFTVDVTDNRDLGSADTFGIQISNGYNNGPKAVTGGNIEVD